MIFPSFIQVPLRRVFGQKIGKGSKIKFGVILVSKTVNIGRNVKIGPFCNLRSENLIIGDNSVIKPLSSISTRLITLGQYVHIAPLSMITSSFTKNSILEIGDHSRIFPYCWLDTGEGIYIGKNVGVGGHSLLFTHGVWPDYVDGGPIAYGPIVLEDNVWLPWRVFIMPNVTIGKNSIVGANSLVNKSFNSETLIGGSPAKILKENIKKDLSQSEKVERMSKILVEFSEHLQFKGEADIEILVEGIKIKSLRIIINNFQDLKSGDLLILIDSNLSAIIATEIITKGINVLDHNNKTISLNTNDKVLSEFISFLRLYGVRLSVKHIK